MVLREMDSNHRPLGYEPSELPLLPPHDIKLVKLDSHQRSSRRNTTSTNLLPICLHLPNGSSPLVLTKRWFFNLSTASISLLFHCHFQHCKDIKMFFKFQMIMEILTLFHFLLVFFLLAYFQPSAEVDRFIL